MTQEEKLKEAKRLYKTANTDQKYVLESLFPELKESEGEMIRKEIVSAINIYCSEYSRGSKVRNDMLAWVEKQGGQKPANKVEPKFHKGDWVVYCNEDVDLITGIEENGYTINEGGYIPFVCASDIRLWTVQDAKDGDVLSYNDGHGNDCIELIKSITDKKIEFWFCLTNGNRYEVFDGITPYTNLASREDATPATKEQRNQLEKAMADAGYTFDFEKKELRKLKFRVGDIVKSKSQPMLDARKIISIDKDYYWCEDRGCIGFAWEDDCELVEPQPKQEWNEEDEKMFNKIVVHLNATCGGFPEDEKWANKFLYWLKSLKDRLQPQPKQEWSEEDETIAKALTKAANDGVLYGYIGKSKLLEWLKSLKDRVQSHWKPSEEQMKALQEAIIEMGKSVSPCSIEEFHEIQSLYCNLKKLTE